jgi:hypothetical protein
MGFEALILFFAHPICKSSFTTPKVTRCRLKSFLKAPRVLKASDITTKTNVYKDIRIVGEWFGFRENKLLSLDILDRLCDWHETAAIVCCMKESGKNIVVGGDVET